MNNEKKKMIVLFLSIIIVVSVVSIVFMESFRNKYVETEEYGSMVIYKGTEDEKGDFENVSYYTSTVSEEDAKNFMEDIRNAVVVNNITLLAKQEFDVYGINALEPYLLRYLNYYLGEGYYEVEIKEETYKEDSNFPSFQVQMVGKEYTIKCIYKRALQRYKFQCMEIEEQKDVNGL